MADGSSPIAREARERAYATPLKDFNVADVSLFTSDTHWPWFERLQAYWTQGSSLLHAAY